MRRLSAVLWMILAVALIAYPQVADATCNSYPNVTPMNDPYYGGYCGGYGGGCTECVDDNDYSHCVTDGASCVPRRLHLTP